MNETMRAYRWYALRTRSRHEKLVRDQLEKQGIEPLLPTMKRLSQWKDRRKEIEVPLFSGYCLARFSQHDKLAAQKIFGVVEVVESRGHPVPIPDEEIAAIKALMASLLPYDSYSYLHEGMTVEVVRGPLRGVQGILLGKGKRHQLVIGIRIIQRAMTVEIDVRDVVPA